MEILSIILIVIDLLLVIPLIYFKYKRSFLNRGFQISSHYAKMLGFLISVNGAIRTGKTSFSSGLKHIFEIHIEETLEQIIHDVRVIFNKIDFNIIDTMITDDFIQSNNPDLPGITNKIIQYFDNNDYCINGSIMFKFYGHSKASKLITDYIFAFYVYYFRRNYVQSKTKMYSHITNSISYDYEIKHQRIHEAFENSEYSIYDFMIEMIDEATDELGASKRYEDVKEERGDKDYRRKFGQIHQERNRMITTKQEAADEIARMRKLTQSNLWIPRPVEQRGTGRIILAASTIIMNIPIFIYDLFFISISFLYYKLFKKYKSSLEEFKEFKFKGKSFQRNVENLLYYLNMYLFSIGFNKYEIWVYRNADDVGITEPLEKMFYYIPIKYCFGTYDTHQYRNIQEELLSTTKSQSVEENLFQNDPYFKLEKNGVDNNDGLGF